MKTLSYHLNTTHMGKIVNEINMLTKSTLNKDKNWSEMTIIQMAKCDKLSMKMAKGKALGFLNGSWLV